MYTIKSAAAAVTGARHLRIGRNGQDAAAVWAGEGCAAAVVCDGCSSGAYSELGARLGAQIGIRLLRDALEDGGRARELWTAFRAQLTAELSAVATAMTAGSGDRERVVHEHFLFTMIAAAWSGNGGDEVAVWAVGDGGYVLGERVVALGPFPNNQPPYLGYELLGEQTQPSHLEVADGSCGQVMVVTDGVVEVLGEHVEVAALGEARCFEHSDVLRRKLAVLAKGAERVDWSEQRIVRQPAPLQDDGAVAIVRWR